LGREDCRIDGLKKKKSQKNPPENNFRRKKEKKSGSILRVKNVAEEYRVRPPAMMIIANSLIPYLFQSIHIHQEKEKMCGTIFAIAVHWRCAD
jgi:hypothetical protein